MTTPPSSPRAVSPPLLSYPPRAVGRSCRPLAIPLMLPHPRPRPRLLFVPSRRSRPLALTSLIAPSDARAPAPSCRSPSPRFAVSPTLACAPHSRPSSWCPTQERPHPRAARPLPGLRSRPPWHVRRTHVPHRAVRRKSARALVPLTLSPFCRLAHPGMRAPSPTLALAFLSCCRSPTPPLRSRTPSPTFTCTRLCAPSYLYSLYSIVIL
jgi:hypothetical protein